jgi:hypothetical protein
VIVGPPPRVEAVATPPGDLPMRIGQTIAPLTVPNPVSSTNLAPDISTFPSSNEPYFQLASNVPPPDPVSEWYQFPSLNGSILLDNTFPPQPVLPSPGTLHAFGQSISYQNQSLMPATWYLNPALNGEIVLVDACGNNLLQAINGDLFYNSELLAKANDIQQITDWSFYPAINPAGVDFDGHRIYNASDISGNTGTFGSITSNGIINATYHAIQNATQVTIGPAAVGTLSSPDGTILQWNGNTITTGSGGDVSTWSTFPATSTITNVTTVSGATGSAVNIGSATGQSLNLNAASNATVSSATGNVTTTAFANIAENAGANYNVTVDRGSSVGLAANLNLTAENGLGGNIVLNSNGGFSVAGQQVGFGAITLNALGATNQAFGLGGKIDLNAYSAAIGEYGGFTSRVSASAATIALSAGAAPTLPGLAGSMNIFGNGVVSIVASLLPPVLPQVPETVYIYGLVGVRLESPAGIQMLSDMYAGNVYPISGGDLILQGRTLPDGFVKVLDCNEFTMTSGGIAQINTIQAVGSTTNAVTIDVIQSNTIVADTQSLLITGKNNTLVADYLVDISMANTIAFDAGGAGAITGVQTINGSAYPPPSGDSSDWATFPAVQNVDMSSNGITNLASMTVLDNATITAPQILNIVAPNKVLMLANMLDLSGGDIGRVVNILSASETDINMVSTAGINITSIDDVMNLTAGLGIILTDPSGVVIITPTVDVSGADITNVVNISGKTGTGDVQLFSYDTMGVSAVNNLTVDSQSGVLQLAAQSDVNIDSTAGGINLASTTQVIVETSVLNMNNNKITNLAAGTVSGDAVNFTQLTFRDTTEFYVSTQGNDANPGSILAPKQTIQAAITAAELISSASSICNINVASGNYTENLTFNKGYVTLSGTLQSQTGNETCEITGSISIACVGANDTFVRQVTFQGFNITHGSGQSTTDTSTASHTVTFQDCKIFANSVFFNSTTTAPDMRFYLTNVEVQQTNAAFTGTVITTNVGLIEFERLDMPLSGNATGVVIGGTSVLNRCSLSAFEASSTAAILRPLIQINSTTTSAHSLGNVAFTFSSAVAKTNTNAVYINSSINTAIIMLNNVFTLAGTANSTNFCVGYNGTGSPTIAGVNNTSLSVNVLLPQTTSVQSGISQVAYIDINPPGLATYSSTIDQPIAVSGTPQALTFNTTQFNQGTTLLASSRVYANAQGNYALNYSVEIQHTGGGPTQTATIFLKKNGTTIANTGRQWSISSGSFQIAAMAEFVVALNAGDYVEVFFSGDTTLSANATAAAGALPAIPSVVFNIKQFR